MAGEMTTGEGAGEETMARKYGEMNIVEYTWHQAKEFVERGSNPVAKFLRVMALFYGASFLLMAVALAGVIVVAMTQANGIVGFLFSLVVLFVLYWALKLAWLWV